MSDRRATLRDVAVASGVSPTTVSFVLNDTVGQTIPPATRARVKASARELGYTPHGLARALREGRSRVVVLCVGDLRSGNSLDSFVRGMREELGARGYALVVHAEGARDTQAALVAGVHPYAVIDLAELYASGQEDADGGWVEGLAAHTMTQIRHLVDRGHQKIALALPVAGEKDQIVAARLRYAQEASRRLGLSPLRTLRVSSTSASDVSALESLLQNHPEVTAVAGFTDEIALRILAAMTDIGLSAPRDLAVIGFDEGRFAALWRPRLTTVRVEAETFGRRIARTILGLETGIWNTPPSSIVSGATT